MCSRSSAAVGSLQAQQSGNELLGLQIKQSLQTQALLATQARADTLRAAEQQARPRREIERARAKTRRVLAGERVPRLGGEQLCLLERRLFLDFFLYRLEGEAADTTLTRSTSEGGPR